MGHGILLLVSLILSWLPVTQDCHGNAELLRGYVVPAHIGYMLHTSWCPDDELGNQQRCITFRDSTVLTGEPAAWLTEPGVDEALIWEEPVSLDWAGNSSDDPCS